MQTQFFSSFMPHALIQSLHTNRLIDTLCNQLLFYVNNEITFKTEEKMNQYLKYIGCYPKSTLKESDLFFKSKNESQSSSSHDHRTDNHAYIIQCSLNPNYYSLVKEQQEELKDMVRRKTILDEINRRKNVLKDSTIITGDSNGASGKNEEDIIETELANLSKTLEFEETEDVDYDVVDAYTIQDLKKNKMGLSNQPNRQLTSIESLQARESFRKWNEYFNRYTHNMGEFKHMNESDMNHFINENICIIIGINKEESGRNTQILYFQFYLK